MSWWEKLYRTALITLLLIVVLQLGGWDFLADFGRATTRAVREFGTTPELPAAPTSGRSGGLWDLHQKDNDAALDAMARAPYPASAPKK